MTLDVAWYLARLRFMSGGEIAQRVKARFDLRTLERSQQALRARRLRPAPASIAFCTAPSNLLPTLDWDLVGNQTGATQLLDGHWPALGFAWRWESAAGVWHRAPDTGNQWPLQYFARIPYRQGNPHGDARVVWEPARLQQLVSLALLASRLEYRERAVALIERQLVSWMRGNPPYVGIHYVSAMECALRLIAVCHALDIVRHWIVHPRATWSAVLLLVQSHARLIERRLSLHSSAANHTVAEATGLVYAGVLFPELDGASRWREQGVALLQHEVTRLILPDGGGAEQATAYLRLVADLATLARMLEPRVAPIACRVDLARRFLAEVRCEFGDDDGGHALSRFWQPPAAVQNSPLAFITFPQTGYTILRSHGPAGHQIGLRHGTIGLPPLHGHGHADLLGLTWRNNHRELLVDAGTFTYTGDPAWRRYFRGTAAHNTVTIDGLDQSNPRGAFMWQPTVSGRLLRTSDDGGSLLLACHDGFPGLGVRHWRGLIYGHGNRLVVWDYISGRGAHTVSMWWHLGEDVELSDGRLRGPSGLSIAITGANEIRRYRGSIDPIAGWRSFAYGTKVPNTCVEARYHGALPHSFCTVIATEPGESTPIDAADTVHLATLRAWVDAAEVASQAVLATSPNRQRV